MKKIIKLICLIIPVIAFAGNHPKSPSKVMVQNGGWRKVTVLGVLVNTTLPGQNKVIGFECHAPKTDECLHYYVWDASIKSEQGIRPGLHTDISPLAPLPINMDEHKYYLELKSAEGKKVYELNTLDIVNETPENTTIQIDPSIQLP